MAHGPHWVYVLADEDGTKMEMTIYDVYGDKYRGLEKQEGKWVEIFRVKVGHAYSGFKAAKSLFRLTAMSDTQVHIIDPLNNRLYFDFKSIHEIPHISSMDRNYPIVVFNTEAIFDDPERPKMVFYIRDNIENQIKLVATGHHTYAFQEGFQNRGGHREVIVVLKMWRSLSSLPSPLRVCCPSFTAYMVQRFVVKLWLLRIGEFPHFQTFLPVLDT
uniref:Replication protein A 70 kDa DNA-binding subunit B/D first OB fold domain-containing protein n=1 Tax=Brassica oleracea var. oleracea TaxID=109376 RepID=A0A0D3BFU9_BRAOL